MAVAEDFVRDWVFVYGPPVYLLSDNGPQFTSKIFLEVRRILRVNKVFTTTYHTQCNGQVERLNRTIVSELWHYLGDNQDDWDLFTDALTYGYNATVSRMMGVKPFELVLSRRPETLSIQARPNLGPIRNNLSRFKVKYRRWIKALISTEAANLRTGQQRYKSDFDARLKRPLPTFKVEGIVHLERETALKLDENSKKDQVNNKMVPLTEVLFKVMKVGFHTVTIERADGA